MNRRSLLRVGLTLLALLLLVLAGRTLWQQWHSLQAQPVTWGFVPAALALAAFAGALTYGVLIDSWRRILGGYDHPLPFPVAARIWILSNFGKYLPGSLWIVAGMAVMAKGEGVRATAAVTSAAIMQALALVSGMVVGAFAPGALAALPAWGVWVAGGLAVVCVSGLAFLLSPRALAFLQGLLPAAAPRLEPIRPSALGVALLGNLLAWLGYGCAIHFLAAGLFDGMDIPIATAAGTFAVAYLAGLLAIPAPGGIGVRETIFSVLLAPAIGIRAAVALAVASRLLMTLIELALALPAALQRRQGGPQAPTSSQ